MSPAPAIDFAPVVVVFMTMPVPSVAQFMFAVPSVWVAVFATPLPPLPGGRMPDTPVVRG